MLSSANPSSFSLPLQPELLAYLEKDLLKQFELDDPSINGDKLQLKQEETVKDEELMPQFFSTYFPIVAYTSSKDNEPNRRIIMNHIAMKERYNMVFELDESEIFVCFLDRSMKTHNACISVLIHIHKIDDN